MFVDKIIIERKDIKMILEIKVKKLVHANDNFQVLGCIPLGDYPSELVLHPTYHNFTVIDYSLRLQENRNYKVEVEAEQSKRGLQYRLISIPSLEFESVTDITDDMELQLLEEITTPLQASNIHDVYPNFIRLVLSGEQNKIDINKIPNVGQTRFKQYIDKVKKYFNYFLLRNKIKWIDLSNQDCKELLSIYDYDMDKTVTEIETNPYKNLYDICNKSFANTDIAIIKHKPELKLSFTRIEYMIEWVLRTMEGRTCSTWFDASEIAQAIYKVDSDVVSRMKDVCIESDILMYEEDKNLLQRTSTYYAEKKIANFLKTSLKSNKRYNWNWQKYNHMKDGELTGEQLNALKTFCENKVMILQGYSGTGKTSSMMALLQMIEDYGVTYTILAPTGKAGARFFEQTGRRCSTVHRACMNDNHIDSDIVIVDEFSMMSIDLLNMLFSSISHETRLVFIGDSEQIPSIGLGRVMKDMIESKKIPIATLTKCFRFKEGGASYVSALTRDRKWYFNKAQMAQIALRKELKLGTNNDYHFIEYQDLDQLINIYMDCLNQGISHRDICMLIPYNIGNCGTLVVNNMIQERINPVDSVTDVVKCKYRNIEYLLHKGDLVMNIKNNYSILTKRGYEDISWNDLTIEDAKKSAVYNGQVGEVLKVIPYDDVLKTKVVEVDIDGEVFIFSGNDISNLILAYASNPYKYQGSQSKYVINVIIPEHQRSWNKQLLYTAQTRMSKKLIEVGDIDTMMYAVDTLGDDNRNTRLKEFLNN